MDEKVYGSCRVFGYTNDFCCMDINEILINIRAKSMKNEGVHQQIAYISVANSRRELKVESIYCQDDDILPYAQIYKSCFLGSKI